jgi:hypothetical protein
MWQMCSSTHSTTPLDGDKWLASLPGRLISGIETRNSLNRRLSWFLKRSECFGEGKNLLLLPGFEPPYRSARSQSLYGLSYTTLIHLDNNLRHIRSFDVTDIKDGCRLIRYTVWFVIGSYSVLRYYRVGVLRIASACDQYVIMFASISFSHFPPGSVLFTMLGICISENSVNYSSLLGAVRQKADYIKLFCFVVLLRSNYYNELQSAQMLTGTCKYTHSQCIVCDTFESYVITA